MTKGMKFVNSIDVLEKKLNQLFKEPDNSELLNNIGGLLYQLKDFKNAEMYLQRAYELNPSEKDILYNYASILYFQLKWQDACSVFRIYSELNPDDKMVFECMRDCFYHLGEYDSAAKIQMQN